MVREWGGLYIAAAIAITVGENINHGKLQRAMPPESIIKRGKGEPLKQVYQGV